MKQHTKEGQIATIYRIRDQLKTYLRWKECGTKAKYFSKETLHEHLFHLKLISQTTDENKIAKKADQLFRLLTHVLKKEYQTEPRTAYITNLTKYSEYRKKQFQEKLKQVKQDIKDGKKDRFGNPKVPSKAGNSLPAKNQTRTKEVRGHDKSVRRCGRNFVPKN